MVQANRRKYMRGCGVSHFDYSNLCLLDFSSCDYFSYAMCNVDEEELYEDYEKAGDVDVLKSQYQDIYFFVNPTGDDMVMKLDSTIQQASSYRPHYHEFAVHFPARFLESVENVLFVGGGDSMVLHEVLKCKQESGLLVLSEQKPRL